MFIGCKSLRDIDISSFDFSNIINMDSMFSRCTSLEHIKFSEEVNSIRLESMDNIFNQCKMLKEIYI